MRKAKDEPNVRIAPCRLLAAKLLLAAVFVFSSPRLPAQASQLSAVINADRTNLRAEPSIDASILAVLRKGAVAAVIETGDAWTKITVDEKTGWVRSSTLSVRQSPRPAPGVVRAEPSVMRGTRPPSHSRRIAFGILGSVTPIDVASEGSESHIAILPFAQFESGRLGIYAAPEFGRGGGYRSTMLGGGLALQLADTRIIDINLLLGYTTYNETPTVKGIAPPSESWSGHGASGGGFATVRLFGPIHLGYRGQYVLGFGDNSNLRFSRHSVGLVF
jgi:hypothetical protein